MTQPEMWSRRLTTVVASQIARLRAERHMSAQQLADATATLGHPIPRSVIANLESGRRETLSVAELLVMARALDVAPVLLVFPVGHEAVAEPLPDAVVDTWRAAKWFTGESPLPLGAPGEEWSDRQRWEDSPMALFRDHEELVRRWVRANASMAGSADVGEQGWETPTERPDLMLIRVQEAEYQRRGIEDQIRRHRALIRREGLVPPALPGPMQYIGDDLAGGDRGQR